MMNLSMQEDILVCLSRRAWEGPDKSGCTERTGRAEILRGGRTS